MKTALASTRFLSEAKLLQDCRDTSLLLLDERPELGGGHVEINPFPFLEQLLPGRALHQLGNCGFERLLVLSTDIGRSHQSTPVDERSIDALLPEGRNVDT